jgi:hypothetical protein
MTGYTVPFGPSGGPLGGIILPHRELLANMEAMDKNVEFFSMENMKHNEEIIDYAHTAMCVISGCIAGVMGLTSLTGFALMLSLYMVTPAFMFHGIGGHVLSFVLFWTLAYGLVHIY